MRQPGASLDAESFGHRRVAQVGIDQQHARAAFRERGGDVHRNGGLTLVHANG